MRLVFIILLLSLLMLIGILKAPLSATVSIGLASNVFHIGSAIY